MDNDRTMNPYVAPEISTAQDEPGSNHVPWTAIGAFLGMTSVFFCIDSLPLPGWLVDRFYDPVDPYRLISVLMVSGGLVGALLFDLTLLTVRRINMNGTVGDGPLTVWFWPIAIAVVLAGLAFDWHTFGTPPSIIAKVPVVLFVAMAGHNYLIWRLAKPRSATQAIPWSKQT